MITDVEAFKAAYNSEYYYELEYNEWVTQNFYQGDQAPEKQPEEVLDEQNLDQAEGQPANALAR